MKPGRLYHYSITTLKLQPLLLETYIFDKIIHNLQLLVNAKLIKVYGYVVLPNRIEFLWEMLNDTEEESPHIQFLKLSSFDFLELLRQKNKKLLDLFCIDMLFQKIQFWQKSHGPVQINDPKEAAKVLERIHKLAGHSTTCNKGFSSQSFYNKGVDKYRFLQHYQKHFEELTVSSN